MENKQILNNENGNFKANFEKQIGKGLIIYSIKIIN